MSKPCRVPGCSGLVYREPIRLGPRRRYVAKDGLTAVVVIRWKAYPDHGLCYYHTKTTTGLMARGT